MQKSTINKKLSRPSYLLREFDKPLYLASYFGFLPIDCPKINDSDHKITEGCGEEAQDKAAFLRMYTDNEFVNLPHPLSVVYRRRENKKNSYHFHILGFTSAMAEAVLIRTGLSILEDAGYKHLLVEINSMGDKDSILAYERELHNYAKKVACDIPPEYKKILKDNIFELLKIKLPENLLNSLPPSIASLTSASRAHFKEMLECLEYLGVEFRLAHTLVGDKQYASHTIFAIKDADDESMLALGSRYSRLSKRMGFKKEMPAVSMTVFAHPKKEIQKTYKDLPKPKFYLVQLGREAKMKSLPLIELLRQSRIPVYHFLGKDKIIPQLSHAENLHVPYLLIVGQKEALDNTVTVRNVITRAQDTIKMQQISDYLKNIAL